jgi:hypothetical protein
MERRGVLILTTIIAFGTGTPYLLMLLRKVSDVSLRPMYLKLLVLARTMFLLPVL